MRKILYYKKYIIIFNLVKLRKTVFYFLRFLVKLFKNNILFNKPMYVCILGTPSRDIRGRRPSIKRPLVGTRIQKFCNAYNGPIIS